MTEVSNFFISVVAPITNDADIVAQFLSETVQVLRAAYRHYELILVDDNSTDATGSIICGFLNKQECIRYIRLSRKFGTETAISCGLDTAIGDVVVILEPQWDPPALIPAMAERVRATNGVVFGVKKDSVKGFLNYRLGKKIFDFFCSKLMTFHPPQNASYFIGLTRQSVNAIIQIKDGDRFIRVFGAYIGFSQQIFEYEPIFKRATPCKRNFFDSVDYALAIIVSNTTAPLSFITYLSIVICLAGVLSVICLFLILFLRGSAGREWTTPFLQPAFILIFLSAVVAVFSQYIGRLVRETKPRPQYFIEKEINSCALFLQETKKNIVRRAE